MKLTVLGAGTLVPSDRRHSAAHLVEDADVGCLFDCGPGTLHGFPCHGARWQDLTHVALTHFHTDHIADLAPLIFALKWGVIPARTETLTVLGPPGLRERLAALSDAFGDYVLDPGFPLGVVELGREDTWEDPRGRFSLASFPTPHTDTSVAYRWEGPEGSFGYTGDTGPSEPLGDFFRGVDVLACECSLPASQVMEGHMDPRSVAALACSVRPGLLLLTHIYPPMLPDEAVERVRQAGFQGRTLAPEDGTVVEWAGPKGSGKPAEIRGVPITVMFPKYRAGNG